MLKLTTKNILTGLAAAIFVIFISVGGSLAFRLWDPAWNPFRLSHEEVMKIMSEKERALESWSMNSDISVALDAGYGEMTYSLSYDGDFDRSDDPSGNSSSTLVLTMESDSYYGGTGKESYKFGVVKISQDSYIKPIKVPSSSSYSSYSFSRVFDPSANKKKWIKYSQNWQADFKDDLKEKGMDWVMKESSLEDSFNSAEVSRKVIQADAGQLVKNILSDAKAYSFSKELPEEEIDGKPVYHYEISISKDFWRDYFIAQIKNFGVDVDNEVVEDNWEDISDEMGECEAQVWIGKKDNYIYRFQIDLPEAEFTTLMKMASGASESDYSSYMYSSYSMSAEVKLSFDFSNFNKKMEISAPEGAKSAEDLAMKALDSETLSDMASELNYDIKSAMLTLRDSIKYSRDTAEAQNKVKDSGGSPVFYSSGGSYCAFTPLIALEGKSQLYYCFSSTGDATSTKSSSSYYGSYYGNNITTEINPGQGYCNGGNFKCPSGQSSSYPSRYDSYDY